MLMNTTIQIIGLPNIDNPGCMIWIYETLFVGCYDIYTTLPWNLGKSHWRVFSQITNFSISLKGSEIPNKTKISTICLGSHIL